MELIELSNKEMKNTNGGDIIITFSTIAIVLAVDFVAGVGYCILESYNKHKND